MRPFPFLAALLLAAPAAASTDDAWGDFRAQVETACRALLDPAAQATVEVNPFGSDRYGVALLTVTAGEAADRLACVYDKATGAAELTAPFAPTEAE